jgi:hypothetical protein
MIDRRSPRTNRSSNLFIGSGVARLESDGPVSTANVVLVSIHSGSVGFPHPINSKRFG